MATGRDRWCLGNGGGFLNVNPRIRSKTTRRGNYVENWAILIIPCSRCFAQDGARPSSRLGGATSHGHHLDRNVSRGNVIRGQGQIPRLDALG